MNRRTLLQGAVATAVVGATGVRRPSKSFAARRVRLIQQELPQYEMVSFYDSTEFIESNGQFWRGGVRGISNDGRIIGESYADGLLAPTVWDSALMPTLLDMGTYAGTSAYGMLVNSAGNAVGVQVPIGTFMTEAQAQGSGVDLATIFWKDGVVNPDLSGSIPPDSAVIGLLDDGTMIGTLNNLPTRWVNDVPTSIDLPEGFVNGGFRSYNSTGAFAGTLYRTLEALSGGVPFTWSESDGYTISDPPSGNAADWAGRMQVYSLSDDGSFAAIVRGESDLMGQGVRYSDGAQTSIADLNGEGLLFRGANASGVLVGQSMLNGISIPTMWVNDQPIVIADLIKPGPDLIFMNAEAINDHGVIAGDAQDSAGVFHHVRLQPV